MTSALTERYMSYVSGQPYREQALRLPDAPATELVRETLWSLSSKDCLVPCQMEGAPSLQNVPTPP